MYYDDEDIVDRMMRILGIKQGNEESVEEFTKRYDSRILLWKGELPEEEKRIWYVLGLKRQYLYEVEDLLPETYDQAKQLALMVEARMKGVMNEVKDVVSNGFTDELGKSKMNEIEEFPVMNDKTMNNDPDTGVEKDEKKAFIYYQEPANMESYIGRYNDGCETINDCHRNGIDVEIDESGEAKSCEVSVDVEKDERKAFIRYQKSDEIGISNEINNLGCCDQDGISVENDELEMFERGVKDDDDRENIDDADAEDRCNEAEVDEDGSMVFEWCIKSTKLGDCDGDEIDEHKTFVNYQKPAELDNDEKSYIVGCCYQNEKGVETNEYTAFTYLQKSAEGDYTAFEWYLKIANNGYQYEIRMIMNKRTFAWNLKPGEVKSPDGRDDIEWCDQYGIEDAKRQNEKGKWIKKDERKEPGDGGIDHFGKVSCFKSNNSTYHYIIELSRIWINWTAIFT
ncbi:HCP-like protein [Gigaspora margarita]|nr:HCP-like protein [Gigaspora margarita]